MAHLLSAAHTIISLLDVNYLKRLSHSSEDWWQEAETFLENVASFNKALATEDVFVLIWKIML